MGSKVPWLALNLLCLGQLLLQDSDGCLQLVHFVFEATLCLEAEGQDWDLRSSHTALQLASGLPRARRLAPPGPCAGRKLRTP